MALRCPPRRERARREVARRSPPRRTPARRWRVAAGVRRAASAKEAHDALRDMLDLAVCEVGMDGQREHLTPSQLRAWQGRPLAEPLAPRRLPVNGHGVVDAGLDLEPGEVLPQRLAVRRADHVL